jgi:hypothetical protein
MSFVNITAQEMSEFLTPRGFKEIEVSYCRETVYGRDMGNGYTLAVFTGIEFGESRRKGKDAIRVALMHGGKVLTSLPHVKRVTEWKANLTDRLRSWKTMAHALPCPLCGSLLLLRRSKQGKFYGCSRYPECKGTRQ